VKAGRRTGFLDFEPTFKSTSLGVPLRIYSCHSERIHLAWMQAELRRSWSLSSEHQYFFTAKDTFIQRLHKFCIPNKIIDRLRLYDPRPARSVKAPREVAPNKGTWLVLPYHPVLASAGVAKAMREASMNDTFRVVWRGCFGEDAAMGISWR
jgi:hypothetical protein